MGQMADARPAARARECGHGTAPLTPTRKDPTMPSPRRLRTIALVALALLGASAPAAVADPDTNIQKPGHIR
jgi:hypothetical protein